MPPLSVLMEMAFLLQISASPIKVNFNADMNEKPENIYSIYYPTITTRWVISIIFTHSEWVILSKTTHSEWAFLEKRLLFTFYLASTEPHFLRLLRSEGVIDSLSLITYLPWELARVRWMVTMLWLIWCKKTIITMQESNYIDCVTFVMWLYDTYHTVVWQMPYNHMTYTNV